MSPQTGGLILKDTFALVEEKTFLNSTSELFRSKLKIYCCKTKHEKTNNITGK